MNRSVTLICTTYNCKDELGSSLEAFTSPGNLDLLKEIVIVDGGSKDGTWELLQSWSEKINKLHVYKVDGANISRGRNEAVRRANSEIIVSFDSGTTYDSTWLKLMLAPFKDEEVAVVGGSTVAYGNTRFQKCLSLFYNNRCKADLINPSHRGIAYLKSVWEKIGGYPEHVAAGEDTWFNTTWRNLGYKYVNVKEAKNHWLTRSTWSQVYKMTYRNTCGHISLGEPTGTLLLVIITCLYLVCFLCLIGGLFNHILWYPAVVIYSFYLMKRLFGSGRWRIFIYPINFFIGWYALLAFDLGTVMGTSKGMTVFLFDKVFRNKREKGG